MSYVCYLTLQSHLCAEMQVNEIQCSLSISITKCYSYYFIFNRIIESVHLVMLVIKSMYLINLHFWTYICTILIIVPFQGTMSIFDREGGRAFLMSRKREWVAEPSIHVLLRPFIFRLNPIQTGLFWSICDWGGGGIPRTPPLYLWNQ